MVRFETRDRALPQDTELLELLLKDHRIGPWIRDGWPSGMATSTTSNADRLPLSTQPEASNAFESRLERSGECEKCSECSKNRQDHFIQIVMWARWVTYINILAFWEIQVSMECVNVDPYVWMVLFWSLLYYVSIYLLW